MFFSPAPALFQVSRSPIPTKDKQQEGSQEGLSKREAKKQGPNPLQICCVSYFSDLFIQLSLWERHPSCCCFLTCRGMVLTIGSVAALVGLGYLPMFW